MRSLTLVVCTLLFGLASENNAAQPLDAEDAVHALAQILRAAPTDPKPYNPRTRTMEAVFGFQRYQALGLYGRGRESTWFDGHFFSLVAQLEDARARDFKSLTDRVDPELQKRITTIYRDLYRPIVDQINAENEALLFQKFGREVFDLEFDATDPFVTELWNAVKNDAVTESMLQRYALDVSTRGIEPRRYLNLRMGLVRKDTPLAVGSRLWSVSFQQLGFGLYQLQRAKEYNSEHFSNFAHNVGALINDLLLHDPATHPATRLTVLDAGAQLLHEMRRLKMTEHPVFVPLQNLVARGLREFDLKACALLMDEGTVFATASTRDQI